MEIPGLLSYEIDHGRLGNRRMMKLKNQGIRLVIHTTDRKFQKAKEKLNPITRNGERHGTLAMGRYSGSGQEHVGCIADRIKSP